MWDLPRPGLEPVSPALAGGFSTTAPPGKPLLFFLSGSFLKRYVSYFAATVCTWFVGMSCIVQPQGALAYAGLCLFSLGNRDSSLRWFHCDDFTPHNLMVFCSAEGQSATERLPAPSSVLDWSLFFSQGHQFITHITMWTSLLAMFPWFSDSLEGEAINSSFGVFHVE